VSLSVLAGSGRAKRPLMEDRGVGHKAETALDSTCQKEL
jgi:hypothetical protein